ncbi:MAG: hypothetical protein JRG83_14330 [Deltaproteobacteria bacterium]|nr:hypothetical protein [Deltaproteobacteria bacterium]
MSILGDRIEPDDFAPIRRKRLSPAAYADREVTLCVDAKPSTSRRA